MFLGVTHVVLVASRVEAGIGESGPYYISQCYNGLTVQLGLDEHKVDESVFSLLHTAQK